MDYIEISVEEFVVGRLLVLAVIVNEPDTVEAVHPAVISDTKNSPDLITPAWRFTVRTGEPNY